MQSRETLAETRSSRRLMRPIRNSSVTFVQMRMTSSDCWRSPPPVGAGAVGYRLAKYKVPEKQRLVVAILCGIGMLLVEMILFLARSYLVEEETQKRARREGAGRFGPAGKRAATNLAPE